jgi:pimeloyl-ACP methyl ester carboxylesterase
MCESASGDAGPRVETSSEGPAETVLLVHGAITPRGLCPLLDATALSAHFRVVHYDRSGYPHGLPSDSITAMADEAALVATRVTTGPVHVIGFSIGAIVAVQMTLGRPHLVRSLVLIEPTWATRPDVLEQFGRAIDDATAAYANGRPEDAADHMLRLIDGDNYRRSLAGVLPPDWPASAGRVMSLYFDHDLPAAIPWRLSREQAATIEQPTLIVIGGMTPPLFADVAADVRTLLPRASQVVIPGATHNVVATATDATVHALVSFFSSVTPSQSHDQAPATARDSH